MSDEIARLGLAVDTSQVRTANAELDNFARRARPAAAGASLLEKAAAAANLGMGRLGIGVGFTTGGFVALAAAVGGKAVAAFQQLEKEQATYNAVLNATGFAAGRTADDIENLATSIRKTTLATEGQVRDASAIMLTFRSVTGEAFDDAMRLSQDLAAVGFGSITSAATMLGKALEDPVNGLVALRRVGVSFTEAQKQTIKNFLETGQAAQAQKTILETVRQQVGGAGAAQGNTLSGAWNQLYEATNNWLEQSGATINKALGISGAIRGIAGAIDEVVARGNRASNPGDQLSGLNSQISDLESRSNPSRRERERLEQLRNMRTPLLNNARRAQQEVDANMDSPELGRISATESRFNDSIRGRVELLKEEASELRKTALQREIDTNIKKALMGVEGSLSDEQRKQIESQTRQNFLLREGAALESQRIAMLGGMASIGEVVRAKEIEIQQARKAGVRITLDQEVALKRLAAEQALGITAMQSAADGHRIEAETLGMSVGQATTYTAIQERLNEARRNGRMLTDENIAAITREANALGQAAQNAETMRFGYENLVRGPMQTFQQELQNGATFFDALKKSGLNALNSISSKLMDMAAQNLWKAAFGGSGGGIGGLIGGLFGGGGLGVSDGVATGGTAASQAAMGGGFGGGVFTAHTGGIVGSLQQSRFVHPAYFDDAPKFHTGGIVADEVPIIAKRGEGVFTPDQMKRLAPVGQSAPNVTITIEQHNDFRGAESGSEARISQALIRTKQEAVREAVDAVNKSFRSTPTYLQGRR